MWVRSKNGKSLINADIFYIEKGYTKEDGSKYNDCYVVETLSNHHIFQLGVYSNEEKALKVMDMIQKYIIICDCEPDVFQMPQDDEVNV